MSANVPKIGIVLGPHFVRLASNFGFMESYFYDSQKGNIPKPYSLTGISSGSFSCGIFAPWTELPIIKGRNMLLNLRGSHFFSLNRELLVSGGIETLMPALLPFLPWERIENSYLRNAAKLLGISAFLGLEYKFVRNLFNARSIFSNERLRQLLLKPFDADGFLDFEGIFSSDIKVDIVSANINGCQESDSNVVPYVVTNYRPEHKNKDIFVDGIVRSTSVPAFFPTSPIGNGEFTTDGGVYEAFPIEIPYNHGCDVIVLVKFRYAGQGYLEHDYSKFMSSLHRSTDILVDNKGALVIRGALNINNDLVQIQRMQKGINQLERLANELHGELRKEIEARIKDLDDTLVNLTAFGKRHYNLVILSSRREIPEFNFRGNFDHMLNLGREIGLETYNDSKEEIYRAAEMAA